MEAHGLDHHGGPFSFLVAGRSKFLVAVLDVVSLYLGC